MDNNENRFKGFLACGIVPRIRKTFQVLFYISLIASVFIFIKLVQIEAGLIYYAIIVFEYVYSYAILLVLRALEHLIGRVFYIENELVDKGIILHPEQKQGDN